ncbi:hypothetical protein OY671_012669, partial [Metschnikowia pulcherrima]
PGRDGHRPRGRSQGPAEAPDRGAARLLRRGGPRDRDRRARDHALWRAGLCPARDRSQPLRCGRAEVQGRDLRGRAGRSARWRVGRVLGAWRAQGDSGGSQFARAGSARRHSPTGEQGPPAGRTAGRGGPSHPVHRPP